MPLSPFFANLMLRDFDASIENHGLNMIRYADDFIILSSSKTKCFNIHKLCKEELAKIELNIPEIEDKTKTKI